MNGYKTLNGKEIKIESLPKENKEIYSAILRFYNKKPHWNVFANYWNKKIDGIFKAKTKRGRERVVNSALWKIGMDLECRLGIEQGYVKPLKKENN